MIHPRDIRAAEYIIDTSDIVGILIRGRRRSNRGRKPNVDAYRQFFIGGFLTVHTRGSFVIEDIHATLTEQLPVDEQFRLGVRRWVVDEDGERTVDILGLHDLYYVSKTLSALDYGLGAAPDLDPDERQRRHDTIRHCTDSLLDVFDLGHTTRTHAIDATGIWSWGRGALRNTTTDSNHDDDSDPRVPDDDPPGHSMS